MIAQRGFTSCVSSQGGALDAARKVSISRCIITGVHNSARVVGQGGSLTRIASGCAILDVERIGALCRSIATTRENLCKTIPHGLTRFTNKPTKPTITLIACGLASSFN